jgi:predicted deacylase
MKYIFLAFFFQSIIQHVYTQESSNLSYWNKFVELYKNDARAQLYGKSVLGKDLIAIKLGENANVKNKKLIIIIGALHGQEHTGILEQLIIDLPLTEEFKKYVSSGGSVLIVPFMNPDGYVNNSRLNSHLIDLNRDFSAHLFRDHKSKKSPAGFQLENLKTQIEVSSFKKLVHKLVVTDEYKLELFVDYHCCSPKQMPSLLVEPEIINSNMQNSAKIISIFQESLPGLIVGNSQDNMGYTPKGSSDVYIYKKYSTSSFTFEARSHDEMSLSYDEHFTLWKALLSSLR